jgi:hypothetical protein
MIVSAFLRMIAIVRLAGKFHWLPILASADLQIKNPQFEHSAIARLTASRRTGYATKIAKDAMT